MSVAVPGPGGDLDATVICQGLVTRRVGQLLQVWNRVTSTNDVARNLGRFRATDGTVVLADEQISGRGRRGRSWASPRGTGIYVSVLLRPQTVTFDYCTAVQFAAGLAVAECLSPCLPTPLELRWPNDCYWDGQKIAGVLVESEGVGAELDFLVVGVGINVNQARRDFPLSLEGRATSLCCASGRRHDRAPLIRAFLEALERWDERVRRCGLQPLIERWLELSPASRGGWVEVEGPGGLVQGTTDGLNAAGALRVRVDGKITEVTIAEVVKLSPSDAPAGARSA